MTSKHIWNSQNVTKTNEKTIILLTCWSIYDVWKRSKCWKCYYTQSKMNHFHQRMTPKNVWNSQKVTIKNKNQSRSGPSQWGNAGGGTGDYENIMRILWENTTLGALPVFARELASTPPPVDKLMTSQNVSNAGNGILRNDTSIIVINGWHLQTYETYKM